MSIQGKNVLSYKKKNLDSNIYSGAKTITFAHEFLNAGEDAIPFSTLVTPAEWTESGLVNPSGASLLAAQLQAFKSNVTVTSSARGLIQKSEYVVNNSNIYFKNITSLANEVFEVEVADVLITGNRVVDMRVIRVEGELPHGTTDFSIGYQLDINKEEIIVFRDGVQMFRSDDNDSSGATGNYYYLDTDGDGKSNTIRFFESAVGVEAILIASTGGIVDSPNVSTFQQIETLAGQIDQMVPTLAALAGVPESDFQSAPNYVDLKNYGSRLINTEIRLDNIEDKFYAEYEDVVGGAYTADTDITWATEIENGGGSGISFNGTTLILTETKRINISGSLVFSSSTNAGITSMYKNGVDYRKIGERDQRTNPGFNFSGKLDAGSYTFTHNTSDTFVSGQPTVMYINIMEL